MSTRKDKKTANRKEVPEMDGTVIYTAKDVQQMLRIGKTKMQAIKDARIIPFIKIGREYYISKDNFEKWLSQKQGKNLM